MFLRAVDNGLPVWSINIRYMLRCDLSKLQDLEEIRSDIGKETLTEEELSGLDLTRLPKLRKADLSKVPFAIQVPDYVEELDISGVCGVSDVSHCRNLRKLWASGNRGLKSVPPSVEHLDISWKHYRTEWTDGPRVDVSGLPSLKYLRAKDNPTVTKCPDGIVELVIDGETGLTNEEIFRYTQLRTLRIKSNKNITICPPWVIKLVIAESPILDLRGCEQLVDLEIGEGCDVLFFPPNMRILKTLQIFDGTNIESCASLKEVRCTDVNDVALPLSIEKISVALSIEREIDLSRYTNLREVALIKNSSVILPPGVKTVYTEDTRIRNLKECSELEELQFAGPLDMSTLPVSLVKLDLTYVDLPKVVDLRRFVNLREFILDYEEDEDECEVTDILAPASLERVKPASITVIRD